MKRKQEGFTLIEIIVVIVIFVIISAIVTLGYNFYNSDTYNNSIFYTCINGKLHRPIDFGQYLIVYDVYGNTQSCE